MPRACQSCVNLLATPDLTPNCSCTTRYYSTIQSGLAIHLFFLLSTDPACVRVKPCRSQPSPVGPSIHAIFFPDPPISRNTTHRSIIPTDPAVESIDTHTDTRRLGIDKPRQQSRPALHTTNSGSEKRLADAFLLHACIRFWGAKSATNISQVSPNRIIPEARAATPTTGTCKAVLWFSMQAF